MLCIYLYSHAKAFNKQHYFTKYIGCVTFAVHCLCITDVRVSGPARLHLACVCEYLCAFSVHACVIHA